MSKDYWYNIHRDSYLKDGYARYRVGSYARRNDVLLEMLKGVDFKSVVEVAGSEGDILEKLLVKYPFIESYNWSDMVIDVVDGLRKRISDSRVVMEVLDLDFEKPVKADLFISTALEHSMEYYKVIESLEKDALVLLSLPSFDSTGHRIYFPQFTDVIEVYGGILDFIKVRVFLLDVSIWVSFIFIVKKVLDWLGLLDSLVKRKIFGRGVGRNEYRLKWLFLARRK